MNTVVYYPYIYPTPEWLRIAALIWERVYLLGVRDEVGGTRAPPSEIAILDNSFGNILDDSITFTELVTDDLINEFKAWVVARKDVLKRHKLSSKPQELFGLYDHKFLVGSHVQTEESVRDWLIEQGLAKIKWANKKKFGLHKFPSEGGYSRFLAESMVYLPADIALHYLSLCAAKAAQVGNRDLVAADEPFTDIVFHRHRCITSEVASNILQAYLPKDFNTLDTELIAEFRDTFANQRLKYQSAVQMLCREFMDVASEGQLEYLIRRIQSLAEERVEETKRTYSRAKLETATKVFSLSLAPPAIVASLASMLGTGVFVPAGIVAAISLLGVKVFVALEKAKEDKAKSPWSYVLSVGDMDRSVTREAGFFDRIRSFFAGSPKRKV